MPAENATFALRSLSYDALIIYERTDEVKRTFLTVTRTSARYVCSPLNMYQLMPMSEPHVTVYRSYQNLPRIPHLIRYIIPYVQ